MTTDPRGRWFRVYARQVRQHPKFRDLNVHQLGAWLVLRSEAELRDGAVFADRADAVLTLRRRGTGRPSAMLDSLLGAALFDVMEDGCIAVHDRADHDRAAFPSDNPEKVLERVHRHRSKKAGNEPVTSGNEKETTPVRAHSGAGAEGVSASLSDRDEVAREDELPEDWDAPDAVVAYFDVTQRYPSQLVIDWLNRLSNDHPDEAIATFLAKQYADDPNLGTLLSRTETALKLDAHRRTKADERARAKSQAAIEAPYVKQEQEATPEEREQAELQRQAIGIGLRMGIAIPTDATEVRKFVMKNGSAA